MRRWRCSWSPGARASDKAPESRPSAEQWAHAPCRAYCLSRRSPALMPHALVAQSPSTTTILAKTRRKYDGGINSDSEISIRLSIVAAPSGFTAGGFRNDHEVSCPSNHIAGNLLLSRRRNSRIARSEGRTMRPIEPGDVPVRSLVRVRCGRMSIDAASRCLRRPFGTLQRFQSSSRLRMRRQGLQERL